MTALRFPCDENIPRELGLVAKAQGFEVSFVVDSLRGEGDEQVLARALSEASVLIAEDADFGHLIFSDHFLSGGVVLVRISPWEKTLRKQRLRELLHSEAHRMAGHFTVLSERTTRTGPICHGG